MFLDSFPLHEQDIRPTRPVREPVIVETGKSRSAWPFIVADKGFGVSQLSRDPMAGMPVASPSAFSISDPSSFVT